MINLIERAVNHANRVAIISNGEKYTYKQLLSDAQAFATILLGQNRDLSEKRVAFMVSPGYDYVRVQWAIWLAGGVAVPLCITYPLASLKYVIDDTQAEIVIASPEFESILAPLEQENSFRFIVLNKKNESQLRGQLPAIALERRAMILYTSGTTSLPKGVVTTHANIEAQVTMLVNAWEWSSDDHILCVLPLHHVHGIVNVICCAMWSGAICEFLPNFSGEGVFSAFKRGEINVFMAVPTIYYKLIAHWESLDVAQQTEISDILKPFRLMVCGSAALPVSVMEKWEKISGHILLERYGMTEIGMGLSNPYRGKRMAGHVGLPLPGVQVRLVDDVGHIIPNDQPGEIQVKGANVFKEYWQREKATKEAFTDDGWFKTGDVAVLDEGSFKILGRSSMDIIKSGGYKLSALEIEEILRGHPDISDCGVVGIPDDEWGELVVAVLTVKNKNIDLNALNTWMREQMAAYKTPRRYLIVEELPRNAMGKVTKNDLKKLFN